MPLLACFTFCRFSIDIKEAGVAGAADPCATTGAEWTCASMVGDCMDDPGLGGGPIETSESGSGEIESGAELPLEEAFCPPLAELA